MTYSIEPGKTTDLPPCPCCGGRTRVVRGFVSNEDGPRAVYIVRWAPGRSEHATAVALSIGPWGEGSKAADREFFAFEHRVTDRPGFMIIDAAGSPLAGDAGLLGRALTRAEALQSPEKQEAFDILDAAGEQDPRLHGWWLDEEHD